MTINSIPTKKIAFTDDNFTALNEVFAILETIGESMEYDDVVLCNNGDEIFFMTRSNIYLAKEFIDNLFSAKQIIKED